MSERIDTEKLRHVADQPWAEYAPDIHASLHAMADEIDYLRESEANARAIFAKLREIMGVQMGDGVSILEHADRLRATIAEQAEKLAAAERERDEARLDKLSHLNAAIDAIAERDTALRKLAELEGSRNRILSLVRSSRMKHGLCEPRSRKACTACNAYDDLTEILASWKGFTVTVAAAAAAKEDE